MSIKPDVIIIDRSLSTKNSHTSFSFSLCQPGKVSIMVIQQKIEEILDNEAAALLGHNVYEEDMENPDILTRSKK